MKGLSECLVVLFVFISSISIVNALAGLPAPGEGSFPYDTITVSGTGNTQMNKIMEDVATTNDGILARLRKALNLTNYGKSNNKSALEFVQQVIDYFVSIVGLIALFVLLYGFYLILIPGKTEESLKKARQFIVGAIIALFVMGFSWYIISRFFYIYDKSKV